MEGNEAQTSSGKLNIRVATEIMGWKPHARNTAHWTDEAHANCINYSIRGYVDTWSPSTDISAAFQMEERIKELGLKAVRAYIHYLVREVNAPYIKMDVIDDAPALFSIAHATPEQRCRAALSTLNTGDTSEAGR